MKRKMIDRWCSLVLSMMLLIILMTGCTKVAKVSTKMGLAVGSPVVTLMSDKLKDTRSGRLIEEGFASQLLMLTGLVELTPNNFRLLNEISFQYCAYGIFIEDKEPDFAKELYSIGREYGLRALKQNRGFRKGLEKGEKIYDLVPNLGKAYAPSLLWTALNSGLWIIWEMDNPDSMMGMADVIAMIKRSLELDENYFCGAGKMFLGAYYAVIPEYLGLGGGVSASAQMFKEANAVNDGRFLLVRVLEARYLATTLDNKDLFKECLEEVIEADAGNLGGMRAINELAKMKAQYYLDHINNYFSK